MHHPEFQISLRGTGATGVLEGRQVLLWHHVLGRAKSSEDVDVKDPVRLITGRRCSRRLSTRSRCPGGRAARQSRVLTLLIMAESSRDATVSRDERTEAGNRQTAPERIALSHT